MRTNVYIDGFNLYNRAVKDTSHKCLDLSKLCQSLLPRHEIHRIRYFTALVHARPNDPQAPQRQQIYLRALKTIPNLTMEFGQFRSLIKERPLVTPMPVPANATRCERHHHQAKHLVARWKTGNISYHHRLTPRPKLESWR